MPGPASTGPPVSPNAPLPDCSRSDTACTILSEESAEAAAASLVKELDGPERPDVVAIAGGDGALFNLLPVLVDRGLPVAMLPAGAGNDVARYAGISPDEPDSAITALLEGETRKIDLMALGDGRFVATVSPLASTPRSTSAPTP